MSVFSDAEIDYLGSQRLGRLATVGRDGIAACRPRRLPLQRRC
jgi:hypothetical protein